MELNKNLVFLGMMGSGKSTIGKLISKKLNMNFIDIDQEIEKSEEMKISEIFIQKGEPFFRKIEEKITLKNLKKANSVISLGGGAFINKKIQSEILRKHTSIWLNWSNDKLIKRIRNSQKRPIAIKLNDEDLNKLISKRSKIYSKADLKINCDDLTKNEIVEKIIYPNETKKN